MKAAFFQIDHRKVRVRGKGHGRVRFPLKIVPDIAAAAFLIRSKDQTAVSRDGKAQLLYSTHGIKRRHSRPLIIRTSSSVKLSLFYHRAEGLRYRKSLACRHHIQMGENIQPGSAIVQVRGEHIVIIIFYGKTVSGQNPLCFLESPCGPFSEWLARLCFHFFTVDGNESHCVLKHLLFMAVHVAFQFFYADFCLFLIHHFYLLAKASQILIGKYAVKRIFQSFSPLQLLSHSF